MRKADKLRSLMTGAVALLVASALLGDMYPASGDVRVDVPEEGWLDQVSASLATAEFRVTWQKRTRLADLEASWHAPNRVPPRA